MSRYRFSDRLIEVHDNKVALIHRRGSARPSHAKLPKRFRAEVRELVRDLVR